jgi:hypothetical protein
LKTPHDDKEKERRRRKAPHADAKMMDQRSFRGMKMMDVRSHIEPHGIGVTQKYPPLDPDNEAPWK